MTNAQREASSSSIFGDVPVREGRWDVGMMDSKLSKTRLYDDFLSLALAQSFATASKRSMSAESFKR